MTKVLVVDDEEELADMVAMLIEDLGLESMVATNGREALNLLQHAGTLPVLIITDLMMPYMNGLEFIAQLKQHRTFASIPIIMMSAAGTISQNSQADVFVSKPFDLDTLVDVIESFVSTP